MSQDRTFSLLTRTAAGLSLGTLGGAAFYLLSLPLPWMLGALFFTMVAAIFRAQVAAPMRLRPIIVAIIGVLLGSRFTPEVIDQTGQVAVTLTILLVYLLAVAAVVVPFYRYVGRQDWTTAYFAGMPGGLTEMIEFGEARGANVPVIVLAHSLRIVLTIALMAFLFRVVLGHDVGAAAAVLNGSPLGLLDAAILVACAGVGSLLGTRMRLPAPTFLGPMVLSAAAHMSGLTASAPPSVLVILAQIVLGTVLGCRFLGIAPVLLWTSGLLSLGSTILTLVLAAAAGWAMGVWAGIGPDQALLALAPGGLTEMGLIALAIHADVAFVALHHVMRILIVLVLAPLMARFLPDSR